MTLYTRKGEPFQIDARDAPLVQQHTWHLQRYVRTTIQGKIVRLHYFLLGCAPVGLEWDHKDRDPANNQRANLRLATHSEQMINRRLARNNSSGHKGVCWHVGAEKWIAQLKRGGRTTHLGYFSELADAVAARQKAEATCRP